MRPFGTRLFILLLPICLALTGCATEEDKPQLPAVGTMTAALESQEAAPVAAKNADPAGTGLYTNFANAWIRVKILQVLGLTVVAPPAVAMGLALTQQPNKKDDTWHWTVTDPNTTAELQVSVGVASGWDLKLYITNAKLTDFLWVEGNFNLELTNGKWTLHDPNLTDGTDEALEIEWTYASETDRTLSYENLNDEPAGYGEGYGDVITYSVSGNTSTLVFNDASAPSNIATIIWDNTTGAGYIQVPDYNDGKQSLWDATFQNDYP